MFNHRCYYFNCFYIPKCLIMNTIDDFMEQEEMERIAEEELERQIRRQEEGWQVGDDLNGDIISKGFPTGDRPGEDD